MTKDVINFRHSMKHAHGGVTMENAVGITHLRSAKAHHGVMRVGGRGRGHRGEEGREEEERRSRVTGLMKWSLDDFVVEEVWPDSVVAQAGHEGNEGRKMSSAAFLVPVIAEGVPDAAIAALIERKCSARPLVQFVTPVDFGASQQRFALVRSAPHDATRNFRREQMQHLSDGVVCIGKSVDVPVLENTFSPLPLHHLPDLRYSVVLRGIKGALADVLPRLERLQANGFLNYSHLARHGVSLFRAFEGGRHLLHREYAEFLRGYVLGLTECSPLVRKEMPPLLDILTDPKSTCRSWTSVKNGLMHALKKDDELIRQAQTGLYHPHHALLRDFLERASVLSPKHHDSAQVIRESIPRLLLQEKMRTVADVHFNALASLRWEMYGDQVVVGDLVVPDEGGGGGGGPLDVFEAPADHMNGEMTSVHHLEWLSLAGVDHLDSQLKRVQVVQTAEEAQRFTIAHVVLPVLGRGAERLVLPRNRMREASERLARELLVEGLPLMRAAPPATYRRLIVHPRDFAYCVFDDEMGWCWESSNDAPIHPHLYKDQEGITRQPSPLSIATGKNMIARCGIRGVGQRSHFLKPARRKGMTCVLRMTLPRGSAVTSALREIFHLATLDPGAIFRLLR